MDFKTHIKGKLEGATVVIALITENYYGSPFSMCELGAVWVGSQSFLPVLVPPLGFDALKAVLQGVQAYKLNQPGDLDDLRDRLREEALGGKDNGTPRWNDRRDRFLAGLKAALKKLPSVGPVPRLEHDKVAKEREEYAAAYKEASSELAEARALCRELEEAKDKEQVRAIKRKRGKGSEADTEAFEELVAAVNSALGRLPAVVAEALYQEERRQDWMPSRDADWDAIKSAEEEGLLDVATDDRNAVVSATTSRKVQNARRALAALRKWLESEAGSAFHEEYEEGHEEAADIQLRGFWRRQFDIG